MIWKSLLIGFILNNDRYLWKLLNYKKESGHKRTKIGSALETVPDNITNNNKTYFKNEKTKKPFSFTKKNKKSPFYDGIDYRFGSDNQTETITTIMNITKFLTQMKLLNDLENTNISQAKKLELIDQYNRNEGPPKYSPNKKSGGLFDDWD